MKNLGIYYSKAKWQLRVFTDTLFPVLEYYAPRDRQWLELNPGENVLLEGEMMLMGTSRGCSAANFDFMTKGGEFNGSTSLKGTYKIFEMISTGDIELTRQTWNMPSFDWNRRGDLDAVTGCIVSGFWTVAKQGLSLSLMPVTKRDAAKFSATLRQSA
ncbi:hypothetical protein RPALISO_123 [Ruegeria phage RpAliso]|nr:hypothetical protein RPALISO_123 [Ruegeria phage RpAliso]